MSDRETYTLGYGAGAMAWMTSRTAATHAAFLLPHLKPGMRLLDCGCGPGSITLGLAAQVAPGEVIGIDKEAEQFATAIEQAGRDGLTNLHFETGDIYDLPYPDASFDVVFASAVLGSVAEPERVVDEMARVLKPGGLLALKEFDHEADVIWPQNPVLSRSIELYRRLRTHNGHEPSAGRKLLSYLQRAGCRVNYVHGFYDEKYGPEKLTSHVERNNQLIAELLGQQYLELGWCTQQEINAAEREWLKFAQNPSAVYLATWFEALGTKNQAPG